MLRRILSQSPHILALNRLKFVANASTSSSMNNEILIITERAAKQVRNWSLFYLPMTKILIFIPSFKI
jgi:hypothetical protein